MNKIRTAPWVCAGCGYQCNTVATMIGEEGVPSADGDLTLCLNCGAPYVMYHGAWERARVADLSRLPLTLRQELERIEMIRHLAITEDLSFKQKL